MPKCNEKLNEHYFQIQNITNSLKRTIYKGLRKYNAFELQNTSVYSLLRVFLCSKS